MAKVSVKEFLLRQPNFPDPVETDPFYHGLAEKLLNVIEYDAFGKKLNVSVSIRLALTLADYMQDIVADAGLWRSFVDANRLLYGWSVPFHELPENYVDYELNREDVRFLVWYVIAMLDNEFYLIYPHDKLLISLADSLFALLESEYDEAPVNENLHIARGLEFNDPNDHKAIYALGSWLFYNSYLLTPAFALTLQEIKNSVSLDDKDYSKIINERLEEAMLENTTGPLALFISEWVYLMLEHKLPVLPKEEEKQIHKYYEAFTNYTGGETIRYFEDYDSMNKFFIDALGWEKGKEHLAQAKGAHDYVLMVTPYKGMLMARDVARCIKDPANILYDAEYASSHAFNLLVVRGLCPGDLLKTILKNGWLPDAVFPHAGVNLVENQDLVKRNADFIARCYLQIYYRGD